MWGRYPDFISDPRLIDWMAQVDGKVVENCWGGKAVLRIPERGYCCVAQGRAVRRGHFSQ